MPYELGAGTIRVIQRKTVLSITELRDLPIEDVHGRIVSRLGHPLRYQREPSMAARGNVPLQIGRTISPEKLAELIEKA